MFKLFLAIAAILAGYTWHHTGDPVIAAVVFGGLMATLLVVKVVKAIAAVFVLVVAVAGIAVAVAHYSGWLTF